MQTNVLQKKSANKSFNLLDFVLHILIILLKNILISSISNVLESQNIQKS